MERLDFKYKISKDYERLYDLIQTQRVICIVTYSDKIRDGAEVEMRDICSSSALLGDNSINIGCRGTSYVTAMEFDGMSIKEDFIKQCEHYHLEYIEPDL